MSKVYISFFIFFLTTGWWQQDLRVESLAGETSWKALTQQQEIYPQTSNKSIYRSWKRTCAAAPRQSGSQITCSAPVMTALHQFRQPNSSLSSSVLARCVVALKISTDPSTITRTAVKWTETFIFTFSHTVRHLIWIVAINECANEANFNFFSAIFA